MIANPNEIPITDNHIHVDPVNGDGPLKTAKLFYNAGGRVMIIPNKPSWSFNNDFNFKKAIDLGIKHVKEINQNTEVKSFPISGVHPAEYSKLLKSGKSFEESYELVKKALDYCAYLINENMAIAIGEIGRPHYEVSEEELKYQNLIMKYGMEIAKDVQCPVQLHTESATEDEFKEFSLLADEVGLKREKVIKHFSGAYINEDENFGVTPSLTTSKDIIKKAIKKGNNFLMETDFIDDKTRPGAVLGPKTVPKRTLDFIRKGILNEKDAFQIHEKNVKKVYDIEI
ncbi:MAG: TatD family hydrolase [Methanobrevibacter sp.]|jgi:TatD-related deoxyribonuclease|nr:TatD family hydrolase [Candidatus Methanovirga basalitermitum]